MPANDPSSVTFMQPTVGRIVHFYTPDSGPLAALILAATDPSGRYGNSTLKVFNLDGSDDVVENVLYKDVKAEDAPSWWEWPPRS